jgi:hypothetical protein
MTTKPAKSNAHWIIRLFKGDKQIDVFTLTGMERGDAEKGAKELFQKNNFKPDRFELVLA